MTWNKNMDDAPRDGTLLPCPFCGDSAIRVTLDEELGVAIHSPEYGGDIIHCVNAKCGCSTKVYYGEKDGIEEAWNSRVQQPPEVEG